MSVAKRITRRRRKPRRTLDHDVFEQEFAVESLKSEQLRVTILMGAIFSSVALLLFLTLIFFEQFNTTFRGNARRFVLAALVLFGVNVSYLLVERIILGRLIKKQMKPFPALQYLSAFVETSIPTAGLIIGSFFLGPIYTFFTPAAFIYPLFISLSALRLNVRLCVFTGAVAGLEYSLLAFYFLRQDAGAPVDPILVALPQHLFKGFLVRDGRCHRVRHDPDPQTHSQRFFCGPGAQPDLAHVR